MTNSIIDAVEPEPFSYNGSLASTESKRDPDVMRRLISLYMRYVHPLQRIVDENDSEFLTKLDHPIKPEIASVVYAMCAVGAILKSKAPGSGHLDDLVYYFHKQALTAIEERPKDLITLQTLLIIQNVHVVAHRTKESSEAYLQMKEIATSINLGERVLKSASQDTLSQEELIMRNVWRMLIWWETMANMTSLNNGSIDPLKDLSSKAIDSRPDEIPSPYFYFTSLFKIFQEITKIRLPMSPRDLHPVTGILDQFQTWHNSLPKNLRCNPRTGGTGTSPSHATSLDLYFRLGHILLLNVLPLSARSSPTGLGPRRESPLRILATCANGITAAMGDLVKEPDLRSYCMVHGMRCLTEAATIQLFNSKESDPAISTPAKVNFMKTLWCIKQFNFAVPTEILSTVLARYDTALKQTTSGQRPADKGSQGRRELSLASDCSSSTCSTREGSHITICETDDTDRERPFLSPSSPPQDGAASSLLALSLESPTAIQRGSIESSSIHKISQDVQGLASPRETSRVGQQATEFKPSLQSSGMDTFERDEQRPSSASFLSPKLEPSAQPKLVPGYDSQYDSRYTSVSSYSDHSWKSRRTGSGEHYQNEHDPGLAYAHTSRTVNEDRPPDGEHDIIFRQPPRQRSASQSSFTQNEFGMPRSLQIRESRRMSPDYSHQEPHQSRRVLKDSLGGLDLNLYILIWIFRVILTTPLVKRVHVHHILQIQKWACVMDMEVLIWRIKNCDIKELGGTYVWDMIHVPDMAMFTIINVKA
ncbi:hypothetical protein BGZ79_002013 [Entomortierella chlamydospora]|nr:hypothetical protein BGZ79_002013 [Entomortierella chlamydospora]